MKLNTAFGVLAGLVVLTTAAQAQTLNLSVDGFSHDYSEQVKIRFNGQDETVEAGPFKASINGGASFDAYCVDLQHTNSATTSYEVTASSATSALDNGGLAAKLYNAYSGSVNSKASGAALQLAIWWAVYNGNSLNPNGTFQVLDASNDVKAELAGIGNNIPALLSASDSATVFAAVSHGHDGGLNQNLIGGPNAVPEPATMAIMAVGLVGIARRRRNKA